MDCDAIIDTVGSHKLKNRSFTVHQIVPERSFYFESVIVSQTVPTTLHSSVMTILHYYRETEPPHSLLPSVREQLKALNLGDDADAIQSIGTESCFNVQTSEALSKEQTARLEWLLAETFEREKLCLEKSAFEAKEGTMDLEYGPRMTFASAFSSNAVSICHACGLDTIDRLERSRRFRFALVKNLTPRAMTAIHAMLHDRMTEEEYKKPISTFDVDIVTEKVQTIPIMEEGRAALEKLNKEKGLGFDDFDLDYYTNLFKVCNRDLS